MDEKEVGKALNKVTDTCIRGYGKCPGEFHLSPPCIDEGECRYGKGALGLSSKADADAMASGICKSLAMGDVDQHYREDSPVGQNKEKIKTLVDGHWRYMEKVIESSPNPKKYTHNEVMKMRKWDYTSAMTHGYGHGYEDATDNNPSFVSLVKEHKDWALATFGPDRDNEGLLKHILKEVEEVREDPNDVEEWMDIAILAIHGAWKTGASPEEVAQTLIMKLAKVQRRDWPKLEDQVPGKPIEHLKG